MNKIITLYQRYERIKNICDHNWFYTTRINTANPDVKQHEFVELVYMLQESLAHIFLHDFYMLIPAHLNAATSYCTKVKEYCEKLQSASSNANFTSELTLARTLYNDVVTLNYELTDLADEAANNVLAIAYYSAKCMEPDDSVTPRKNYEVWSDLMHDAYAFQRYNMNIFTELKHAQL